jgi:Tol biopolymer transport system component
VALTGRIPEDGLARATSNAYLTEVRQQNPLVSADLAAVVEKALALQPEDRWQTALDFKDALERVRDHPADPALAVLSERTPQAAPLKEDFYPMPISTPLESDPEIDKEPPRQRKFPWAWLVLLILAAAGAAYFSLLRPDLGRLVVARMAAFSTRPVVAQLTATPSFTIAASATAAPSLTDTPNPTATETLAPTFTPTLPPTATFTATPAPTLLGGGNGLIAYVSESTGKPQIWLMNIDGSSPHALTDQSDGACQPDWSPDGQELVFISPCTGRMRLYKGASLYRINSDGSNLKPLAPSPEGDFDPRWSPDGKSIAFTSLRTGHAQIFLLQLADNTVVNLSNEAFSDWQPVWSPDGASIAYVSDRSDYQIWLMDANGNNKKRFSHTVNLDDLYPAWTADGQFITFSQMSRTQLYPWLMGLRVKDSDTPNEFRIPANWQISFGFISSATPSPDGHWIAFENWNLEASTRQIFIMTFNGGDPRPLTDSKTFAYQPAWQPTAPRP